jgi:hypothetical protein
LLLSCVVIPTERSDEESLILLVPFLFFSFLFCSLFFFAPRLELPEKADVAQSSRRTRSPAPLEPTPRTPTLINRFELPL